MPRAESTPGCGGMSTRGMRSAAASSQAWSGPAPPKATSVKRRGSCPRSTEMVRMARSMFELATRITPQAAASRGRLRLPGQVLHPRPGAVQVERHPPAQKVAGVQAAQHQVGVGDGDLVGLVAPIADRAGVGAGALGTDAQRAARVQPGDRAAARADGVDVDDGQAQGQPGDGALGRLLDAARDTATRRCWCRPCQR